MLVGSSHGPEPYDWSRRPLSLPKAAYSEIGDKARYNAAGVVAHDAHTLIRIAARPISPSALTTHHRGRLGRSTSPSRRLAPDQYCASIGSATLVVEA